MEINKIPSENPPNAPFYTPGLMPMAKETSPYESDIQPPYDHYTTAGQQAWLEQSPSTLHTSEMPDLSEKDTGPEARQEPYPVWSSTGHAAQYGETESAAEIAPMSSEASSEAVDTPAAAADSAAGEQAVEVEVLQFKAGETEYRIPVLSHTDNSADRYREALTGCDVLAIERVGHNYGQPATKQQSPAAEVPQLNAAIADIADKKKGSRGIVYIDIPEDHPDYHVVEEAVAARIHAAEALTDGEAVQGVAGQVLNAAYKTAQGDTIRDDVIRGQLRDWLPRHLGEAQVGVIVGPQHYRAFEGIDPAYDADTNRARAVSQFHGFPALVESIRHTGAPDKEALTDALIEMYGAVSSANLPMAAVEGLEPTVKTTILNTVDEYIKNADSFLAALKHIKPYMCGISDLL